VGIRAKREPLLSRLRFSQELKTEHGSLLHQNKCSKRGKFPALKRSAFSHHVSPPIHHNLTIKKPRSVHHFSQKPLQKHPPPAKKKFSRYHKKTA
jgi:hypothetical protein